MADISTESLESYVKDALEALFRGDQEGAIALLTAAMTPSEAAHIRHMNELRTRCGKGAEAVDA